MDVDHWLLAGCRLAVGIVIFGPTGFRQDKGFQTPAKASGWTNRQPPATAWHTHRSVNIAMPLLAQGRHYDCFIQTRVGDKTPQTLEPPTQMVGLVCGELAWIAA